MPSMSFYTAFRDTIHMGVHAQNFKNGAFKASITKQTPINESLNLLLNSPLLSTSEKGKIRTSLQQFRAIQQRCTGGREPGLEDMAAVGLTFQKMEDFSSIFNDDAKARGVYVPPFLMQTMNDDGTVKETHIWNDETESATVVQGGVPGIPPGAPEDFVRAGAGNFTMFERKENKKPEEESTKGESKKPAKNGKSDFGDGFAKNLRGAFL